MIRHCLLNRSFLTVGIHANHRCHRPDVQAIYLIWLIKLKDDAVISPCILQKGWHIIGGCLTNGNILNIHNAKAASALSRSLQRVSVMFLIVTASAPLRQKMGFPIVQPAWHAAEQAIFVGLHLNCFCCSC